MPATIDDIAAGIDRLNATMDAIAKAEQDDRTARRKQSGAAATLARKKFGTPGVRIKSGIRDILQGRFRKGGRKIGQGFRQWTKKKGLNTTGGALAGAASGVMLFNKAVGHATDRLMEAARRYSEVSASMAVVTAQRDLQNMMRDMRVAERVAPSANALMQAEQSRKNATENLVVALERLENNIAALANNALEFALAPLDRIAVAVDRMLALLGLAVQQQAGDREPATVGEWANDIEQRMRQRVIDQAAANARVAAQVDGLRRRF